MASFLNEELMGTNLDIPEGEIKIDGKVNPVYADAINVHSKKKKETEKILKDKKPELKKPFLGTKGSTTVMPKTKEMKKLKLSEDLFKNEATATMDRKSWELQDKKNNKDVWSDIYNELVDMKNLETPHRRMGKQNRYKGSWEFANPVRVGASRDGGIVVKAEELSDLDFAKEVAETYGVEWRVKEHTSRYADAKFELFIYPYNQVVTESLTESVDNEIYSAVVKRFDYGAPSDFVEVLVDLVDRALMNKDEGYDIEEAVQDAIDSGLIYHKDIWTVKANYEDSTLADETYESLYTDIYSIVESMTSDDVDEGLTSAQRYNRKMDKIFNDKKNRDADMVKFIKANSDVSDEEIKKAQDDDKVGLLLKNKGLHDKYWNKNESLNESRNSKTVILDGFDDKYVNNPEFLSAVTQIIGEYETFGGSVKQIKDFAITVTVDVGSDMTAGSYGCKFKALIDGDFDSDYVSEQWIDFDLSRYDNLVYQCWWEKYDGEDEYSPTSDVITVYHTDVSSKIIDAYLQVDGEAIMYMLEPIETALYDYVSAPDDFDESLNEDKITLDDKDKKALRHLRDYRSNKYDLPTLHKNLEKVYGNKRTAVPRFAELDEISNADIDRILDESVKKRSRRGRK